MPEVNFKVLTFTSLKTTKFKEMYPMLTANVYLHICL